MFMILRLTLIAFIVLLPQFAGAQESRQDPRVANAKTACAAGDVPLAIRLLAELYTATNDPIWIFNQGRCYHQNNQLPQAEARFKEFLRKNVNGPAEDSRDAQNYINEIEADLHKNDPKPLGPDTTVVKATSDQGRSSEEGRGLRYAGIGCWALGGASLAAGVVFSLLTVNAKNDVESKTKNTPVQSSVVSSDLSNGPIYSKLQWVGYGVGAASVITGSVLYYFGANRASALASNTIVAPLFTANGAGATLRHTF
jgi:hypothetical protein